MEDKINYFRYKNVEIYIGDMLLTKSLFSVGRITLLSRGKVILFFSFFLELNVQCPNVPTDWICDGPKHLYYYFSAQINKVNNKIAIQLNTI